MDPAPIDPEAGRGREWRLAGIIFFALVALALLYAAILIIRPFLTAIILGAIIVTFSFGLFRRVRRRMGGRAHRAAAVMLLFITFVIIVPFTAVAVMLVQQAQGVFQRMQSVDAQQIMARVDLASRLHWIKRIFPSFDPTTVSPERLLLPAVREIPSWVAAHGAAVVGGLAGLVFTFALILLSAFFFYVEGESILEQLSILSPLPARYDAEFGAKFKDVIDATFRGQLSTAIAQGVATGVGLAIARVPGAAFWGAVAIIISLLPMVGAAVVWVPAAIYLYITASMGERGYWAPIFLTIWGLVVISLIDNVVRPWAMKGKSELPAIPLLFAVIGGMQAFGFVGLVIGPLVFSLLMTIIDIYKRTFHIQRTASHVA